MTAGAFNKQVGVVEHHRARDPSDLFHYMAVRARAATIGGAVALAALHYIMGRIIDSASR